MASEFPCGELDRKFLPSIYTRLDQTQATTKYFTCWRDKPWSVNHGFVHTNQVEIVESATAEEFAQFIQPLVKLERVSLYSYLCCLAVLPPTVNRLFIILTNNAHIVQFCKWIQGATNITKLTLEVEINSMELVDTLNECTHLKQIACYTPRKGFKEFQWLRFHLTASIVRLNGIYLLHPSCSHSIEEKKRIKLLTVLCSMVNRDLLKRMVALLFIHNNND